MTARPGGRVVRSLAPIALSAALATAPVLGVSPARAITPAESAAGEQIPDPAPGLARITIDEVSPRVFDAGSADPVAVGTEAGVPTVTVTGTIQNVGDVQLEEIDVRLQRGPRVSDAESVREPLVWSEPSFELAGEFQRVAPALDPGASVPFRISMPSRDVPGRPGTDLQLTEPGVYPLLVNVNGTPVGGTPARLHDARTLLPVLDAPTGAEDLAPPTDDGAEGAGDDGGGDGNDDDESAPSALPLTVLWPLAAPPTRVARIPGDHGTDPVVALSDDSLLRDLSEGGRLTGLVRAADDAFDGTGGQELRRATCIAVDPDLLGTVSQIAGGTSVVIDRDADPSAAGGRSGGGRDPQEVDGEQVASDAARWIDELQALTDGGCVVSLPGAQADLDSVARVGEPSLTSVATDSDTVERVLGVETVPDVLVPASGTLDPATPAALGAGGSTALVADRSTRTDTGLLPPPGLVETTGPERTRALTYSSTLGASLAATGDVPENPRYSDPATRYWLTADSPEARLQDARAALLAPIIDEADRARAEPGQQPGAAAGAGLPAVGAATPDPSEAAEQGILAVPPQVWSVDGTGAGSLLDLLGAQLESDRLRAVSLPERLAGPVTTPDGALAEDPTGASDPGQTDPFGADPGGTTEQRLAETLAGIGTLRSLVDTSDPTSALAPAHLDPMVGDALRVLSESGRRADGDGITLDAQTGASARVRGAQRLETLEHTVSASLARVDLLPPGSVFTMASPNSPLLLVARNALPFPVRVSVDVASPPGLHVDPVGMVQVPAAGSRTLQVPTQSDTDGGSRHTVTFVLHGPDGRPLAEPVELSVQSGGYPVAQGFALAAAALALVLGGRRYLRYRRGIHDPADEGHRP